MWPLFQQVESFCQDTLLVYLEISVYRAFQELDSVLIWKDFMSLSLFLLMHHKRFQWGFAFSICLCTTVSNHPREWFRNYSFCLQFKVLVMILQFLNFSLRIRTCPFLEFQLEWLLKLKLVFNFLAHDSLQWLLF